MKNPIRIPKNIEAAARSSSRVVNRVFDVDAKHGEITIYDEIGPWGTTAADVRAALSEIKSERITLNINSPGGDVFDGIAIYNDLISHDAKIDVKVTGLAASAASIIAMAGDTIEMGKGAFLMIHNAWAVVMGNKNDLADMSQTLDSIDGALAEIYVERTGIALNEIKDLMDAETWLTASDSVEQGFADTSIDTETKANALFDLSGYRCVPAAVKRDIESRLRDAGYSLKEAKAAVTDGFNALASRDVSKGGSDPRDVGTDETVGNSLDRLIQTLTTGVSNER